MYEAVNNRRRNKSNTRAITCRAGLEIRMIFMGFTINNVDVSIHRAPALPTRFRLSTISKGFQQTADVASAVISLTDKNARVEYLMCFAPTSFFVWE